MVQKEANRRKAGHKGGENRRRSPAPVLDIGVVEGKAAKGTPIHFDAYGDFVSGHGNLLIKQIVSYLLL